ncbi:chemotaxis protein CheA [Aliarcobacter cibarius]|jgi:two-component system, chemotaxis family, sensor kinase CheA|uniref:Chemotaxis protein CheA n=1 Tax=Aliarcobacter cibarius TaxID=255507 RepID=A0A5J6RH25_9BACT|nr:chemotaxis protein CheA [Aliarcobacter cibarius]QEZ89204.1 chemotaxis sensory histidine kinase [Aliarcobacter cibarius]QKJ27239.1 chemotaxis sensory histidine kinase [Aliarcobacter cibarius]TLT01542.1 chemotaxis protein CheA [Aliarcobacter cibarius]TLT02033.1 chemotaxis protein CheA [Aliarcobacter cibarius]TLT04125.1 chemotaxis protein CheA [Aliarcobacter cibarius]
MSFDISKYREMFLEEASELFESADNVLLEAENNGTLTDDEMGQLFRDVHTLKGSGASVELAYFAEFTHDVENLMDKLRSHKIEFIPEMAETLLDGLDVMKEILDLEVSNKINREKFTEMTASLLEEIRAYSKGEAVIKTVSKPIVEKKVEIKKDVEDNSKDHFGFFDEDMNTVRDEESPSYGLFMDDDINEEHKTYGFFEDDLEKISELVDNQPEEIKEEKEHFGFFDDVPSITPNSVMKLNDIDEKVQNEAVSETKTEVVKTATRKVKPSEQDEETKKSIANNNNNSIRVNLDKIDLLMNNVGDLVITNAMLTQFSSSIEETKTRASVLERLELLERHIRDMQDSIMSIRMVPMESIYSKFPKVVRDISRKLSKKVEFKHYGDNVEIDKAMIEGLTDPLMHIIRNSLDHGIEMPTEREAAGKPETGSISISAEQANGQMIITIEDDGKGIDCEKVALKALEKGQIDEYQYNNMTENEKAMLIFGAGLSTADQITDISGRGVGMDVVKTNIYKLGGAIKLDTKLGEGTTITIMLPLTLAILDGLDIKVGDQKYILPLSSIVESLQPTSDMIKKIGDGSRDLLMLREEFIPIVRLHQLFGLEDSFENLEDGMLIVVKSGNTKVALSIDEFLNQHQVVVKPLDKNFRSVQGIGAATVRGDGSIGLILDVVGIINAQIKIEKDMHSVKKAS